MQKDLLRGGSAKKRHSYRAHGSEAALANRYHCGNKAVKSPALVRTWDSVEFNINRRFTRLTSAAADGTWFSDSHG
jgi:hypothetical protein